MPAVGYWRMVEWSAYESICRIAALTELSTTSPFKYGSYSMTEQNGSFAGGCACGHVRYQLTSKPMIVHGCHCRWCQRESGASFAVNALIEADRVNVSKGSVAEIHVPSNSGVGQRFLRCPDCQVTLWTNYLAMRGGLGELIRFVRVGTLDNPDLFPPDVHIFTSTKPVSYTHLTLPTILLV